MKGIIDIKANTKINTRNASLIKYVFKKIN